MNAARLAFVDHAPFVGGAETVLLDVIAHLDRSRFDPIVFAPAGSPLVSRLNTACIAWRDLLMPHINSPSPLMPLRWRSATLRLARLAREERVDLIHANTVRAHLISAFAAKPGDIPCVWMLHDDTFPRWLFNRLRRRPARLIANSHTTARHYGLEADPRACVVHNGVDTRAAPGDRFRFRRRIGIGPEKILIAHVGRLVRWKGQHLFILAAARIASQFPDARFVLVGDYTPGDESLCVLGGGATYLAELRRLVESSGLSERFTFAGHQDSVADVYAGIDLLVHSSTRPEPFGRVLIEAMAAGVPLIASAQGGPTEIVEDGITGLLVMPGSSQLLAEVMARLLSDAPRRRAMSLAARQRAREHFDIRQQVEQLQSIYESVLRSQSR